MALDGKDDTFIETGKNPDEESWWRAGFSSGTNFVEEVTVEGLELGAVIKVDEDTCGTMSGGKASESVKCELPVAGSNIFVMSSSKNQTLKFLKITVKGSKRRVVEKFANKKCEADQMAFHGY